LAERRRVLVRRHTRVLRRAGHDGTEGENRNHTGEFHKTLHYRIPNASNTFPARPPNAPYPEFTNIMPPEIAGPGPIIEAPRAFTPLTVSNSRFESNSQSAERSEERR